MSVANLKISSKLVKQLKALTGEATGQKAIDTALDTFIQQSKRRNILETLNKISFIPGYDPLALRKNER